MILVDCITAALPSLCHVNVSGGEPCEVQDNVRGPPTVTVIVFDDGVFIMGAAVWSDERRLSDEINKSSHLLLPVKYIPSLTDWSIIELFIIVHV